MVTITTEGVPGGGLARDVRGRSGADVAAGDRKRKFSSQTSPMKAARMEPYVLSARRWRRVVVAEREGVYAAVVVDDLRGYGNWVPAMASRSWLDHCAVRISLLVSAVDWTRADSRTATWTGVGRRVFLMQGLPCPALKKSERERSGRSALIHVAVNFLALSHSTSTPRHRTSLYRWTALDVAHFSRRTARIYRTQRSETCG